MNKSEQHKGFSLIELLVVIAIISILAGVAVPAYQEYLTRIKIETAINYTYNTYAPYMKTYFAQNGTFPLNPLGSGVYITPPSGTNMTQIEYYSVNGYSNNNIWVLMTLDTTQVKLPAGNGNQVIIFFIVPQGSNTVYSYCGQWDAGVPGVSAYVPSSYLPPGCNTSNIVNIQSAETYLGTQ